jgi:Restriction endonuclease/XPA protein C-terminus
MTSYAFQKIREPHNMPRRPKRPCTECGKLTEAWFQLLGIYLCRDCQFENPKKYGLITKTRAMGSFRLRSNDLSSLAFVKKTNPHYSSAAPMQLFLLEHVRKLSEQKWGSEEPYIVTLTDFSERELRYLLEDTERIKRLSPGEFQFLVANRLDRFGLNVQIVGDVERKDGGVDIIAYSKSGFPFMVAVQVKHHSIDRHTPVGDIRDFHGVLSTSNSHFQMGIFVTNTSFSPDAQWFAEHNRKLLRLRDLVDLKRWLNNDFENGFEWREIPEEIELAPGIRISIPKPNLWLPNPEI